MSLMNRKLIIKQAHLLLSRSILLSTLVTQTEYHAWWVASGPPKRGDSGMTANMHYFRLLASDHLKALIGTQVYSIPAPRGQRAIHVNNCPEIFLPSYVECDFESPERKRDPVHEIHVSDEEIKEMMPQ